MPQHVSVTRLRGVALLSAILGTGVSICLLVEYATGQPGLCPTGSGCDAVRASADAAAARALTLFGTPTLYVGGQRYTGPLNAAAIREAAAAAG